MDSQTLAVSETDRRLYVGGSDVASIFGVSPWKSAFALYEEKIADEPPSWAIEPETEKRLRRGKRLEPWIMEMLEDEHGILVLRRNQRYTDAEYPFMSCEVDFEYTDDSSLCNGEIKTVSPFAAGEWGDEGTDEIPLYYCLQALWGLAITERPKTLIAGMIGADDLRVYFVNRDEELIVEMRRRVVEFWQEHVIKRVPPPPQDLQDTNKILARYGGFVSAGNEQVWHAVKRLKGIRAAEKRLKDAKEEYELSIKRHLVIAAESLGVPGKLDKAIINGPDGKKVCTVALQHRAGYTVGETDFIVVRT